MTVDAGWMSKHEAMVGGYYVLYPDGYESYSPAEAFESGYALVPEAPPSPARQNVSGTDLNRAAEVTPEISALIEDAFIYHPLLDKNKIKQVRAVRDILTLAVKVVIRNCPPSPDRSAAIRKLREARMDANSAISLDGRF